MEELPDTLLLPGTRQTESSSTWTGQKTSVSPATSRSRLLLDMLIQQSTTSFLPYTLSKHQRKGISIPTDTEAEEEILG